MNPEPEKGLLPCPFCGDRRARRLNAQNEPEVSNLRQVICHGRHGGCGATGGLRATPEEAILDWNTRPAAPQPANLLPAERLAEIKARAEAATAGPWALGDESDRHAEVCLGKSEQVMDLYREPRFPNGETMTRQQMLDNVDFVINARTDIPALLAHIEALSPLPSPGWRPIAEDECPFCHCTDLGLDLVPNTGGNIMFMRCTQCSAQGPWAKSHEEAMRLFVPTERPQFRILGPDEFPKLGDQWEHHGKWRRFRDDKDQPASAFPNIRFRRPLPPPPAPQAQAPE